MIRVTIEMVPKGDDKRSYILAQGAIVNDGKGTLTVGSYEYGITTQISRAQTDGRIWKTGRVTGFKRKRDNVWRLLALVLDDALNGGSDGTP